ncbi:hypothetical protein N7474_003031 [Penicillium riverlandense]|uniref:uncharacterized protein n=1 Tax=Penicillium riverlandense TaxID=1903569 RepID=UPI0025471EB4|nr:uncharacterized protein N7474_003031 [Penicillium riverlandense]KAJ5825893.1 hypothetical protein N7474_003031 [Penicillium riverlandense]
MARESDAPKHPLTPRRPNDQPPAPHVQQPEFGKPSPLGQPQPRSNHLFNVPKSNQSRPEHHRPVSTSQPQYRSSQNAAPQGYRPAAPPGANPTSPVKRSEPWDPFKPVRPAEYTSQRPGVPPGATEIKRPENVTWTTPRAARTIYTSQPIPPKMSNASKNLQKFIDLTKDDSFPTGRQTNNASTFGAMDVHGYVDSAKANENIKALLEGAFEDEEEEKMARSSSKGKKKNTKKKTQKKKKSSIEKKDESSDLDDLVDQLQGVTVKDQKELKEKEADDAPNAKETLKDDIEDKEAEEQEELDAEADEDDDEEEDDDDDEEDATVEGLKVQLLPHQVEGVRWMCDKETGRRTTKGIFPKGGILADDMGLGKTVQAIALMLRNRRPKHEHSDNSNDDEDQPKLSAKVSKSTLVVAPLALIKQWEFEIDAKVEKTHKLRVCLYHGTNRAKTSGSLDDYDVVITTYGTLTSESATSASDKAKKSGLFSVTWYRIILDEAHTIKNRNAKATQSACALDAEYRWCLTGTPLQNNLDELQSLIKFLRIKPFDDLAAWRDQISRPLANGRGGLAIQRLQVYLKAFMKRRTKDVLKLNANLKSESSESGEEQKKSSNGFQITERKVIKVQAEFMPGELNFYQRLEQRTENSLDKMMGGSKLDYAGALVLLLRLRQSCNHPDLVKSDLAKDKDVLLQNGTQQSQGKQDDLDSVADLFGALSVVTKKCDVCQMELSPAETQTGTSRCSECEADLKTDFIGKAKKKHKSKTKVHKHGKADSEAQPTRSRKNRRVILDSDDEDEAEWIVPEDQRKAPNLGKAGGSDDENAEGGGEWLNSEDSETEDEVDSSTGKKSQPFVLDSSEDESDSKDETDSEEDIYQDPGDGSNILPSTKIRHLMRILNRESADYKFIVFSVFTSMLDKIEPFLKRANIGFARYDGAMRNDHREASLNKLRSHSGTRVLLCSLRAGALGLNLTAASRVVILEPFWNPFVEEQAIDRVHRLNQTLDVKIYKMIIKGTVEERIVDLQERKRELANATLEGKSAAGKLTMRDMMALFGRDAEHSYTSRQDTLDFKQPTRLLSSADEPPAAAPPSSALSDPSRDHRNRPYQQPHRPPARPDDSVYGRRW